MKTLLIGAVVILLSTTGLVRLLAAPGGAEMWPLVVSTDGPARRVEDAGGVATQVPEFAIRDDNLAADFADFLFLHESFKEGGTLRGAATLLCTE